MFAVLLHHNIAKQEAHFCKKFHQVDMNNYIQFNIVVRVDLMKVFTELSLFGDIVV